MAEVQSVAVISTSGDTEVGRREERATAAAGTKA